MDASPATNAATEAQLIAQAQAGDSEALSQLYRQYRYLLKAKCRGVKCQPQDMDLGDLQQVAALKFLSAVRKFDPGRNKRFISYLMRAVTNELNDRAQEATTIRIPHNSRRCAKNTQYKRADTRDKIRQRIDAALNLRVDTELVYAVTTTANPTFDEVVRREEWRIFEERVRA